MMTARALEDVTIIYNHRFNEKFGGLDHCFRQKCLEVSVQADCVVPARAETIGRKAAADPRIARIVST